MSLLRFNINGQVITSEEQLGPIIADTIGYLKAHFLFQSSEWQGLTLYALFKDAKGVTKKKVLLEGGMCDVPHEVIKPKYMKVSVYGLLPNGVLRITTNESIIYISQSGFADDAVTPEQPTPDIYQQINDKMAKQAVDASEAETAQEGAETARDTAEGYMTAAQLAAEQAAGTAAAETVEAASLLLSGYVTDAQTAKTGAETAQGLAEEAQGAAEAAQGKAETAGDTAEREANRAEREADDAEGSKESAATSETVATQAMTDLLAMLGSDIATLTDGKLTPSQIPALSINDVFEVDSVEKLVQLTAERGDVALVLLEDNIHDSYILAADDSTQAVNWKKLGISYVANAGHASTADNAVNADKINNKRIVAMTQSQYDTAVVDTDTIYIVTPEEV